MTLTKEEQLAEFALNRADFHKYLDRTGVLDCFVHAFVALYEDPDRPDNALEYIALQMALAADGPRREQIESLRSTVSNTREKLMEKEAENQRLLEELAKFGIVKESEEAEEEDEDNEEIEQEEEDEEDIVAPVSEEPKTESEDPAPAIPTSETKVSASATEAVVNP